MLEVGSAAIVQTRREQLQHLVSDWEEWIHTEIARKERCALEEELAMEHLQRAGEQIVAAQEGKRRKLRTQQGESRQKAEQV